MQIDRRHYQVIFDPVSKGAVILRKDKTAYLDGPFSTFEEAETAAFEYLKAHDGMPGERTSLEEK